MTTTPTGAQMIYVVVEACVEGYGEVEEEEGSCKVVAPLVVRMLIYGIYNEDATGGWWSAVSFAF